jgi:hypothetical protein
MAYLTDFFDRGPNLIFFPLRASLFEISDDKVTILQSKIYFGPFDAFIDSF